MYLLRCFNLGKLLLTVTKCVYFVPGSCADSCGKDLDFSREGLHCFVNICCLLPTWRFDLGRVNDRPTESVNQ